MSEHYLTNKKAPCNKFLLKFMLLSWVIFDFETPALETEFNLNYLFPSPLRGPISLILYRETISFFAGIIYNAYRMYVFF